MPSNQSRRAVLRTAATGGLFALAGCSGLGSTESPPDDGARLGRIVYRSHHNAAHTLDVVLEYGGEVRLWERFDLDPAIPDPPSSAIVFTGPTPPVRYRLLARLDGEATATLEYAGERSDSADESDDAPCVGIGIVVSENGKLSVEDKQDRDGSLCS